MGPHLDSLAVSAEPASVSLARRFVRSTLGSAVPADVAADLQLVASELVTNAVQYGTEPIEIAVGCDDLRAWVAVTNRSSQTAGVAPIASWSVADVSQLDGRGLGIVRAIADDVELERSEGDLTIRALRDVRPG